ncbi:hypothetical protein CRYUN_Cryun27aG0108000 [Craigia yunnanensis]
MERKRRFTINGISFVHPDTPLKLLDYFQLNDVFKPDIIHDRPTATLPSLGTPVIDVLYHDFYHIVFQNPLPEVYPSSWTAILIELDNQGMWNLRSQNAEKWYLGQELYLRVKGVGKDDPSTMSAGDEAPMPESVIKCGRAANL